MLKNFFLFLCLSVSIQQSQGAARKPKESTALDGILDDYSIAMLKAIDSSKDELPRTDYTPLSPTVVSVNVIASAIRNELPVDSTDQVITRSHLSKNGKSIIATDRKHKTTPKDPRLSHLATISQIPSTKSLLDCQTDALKEREKYTDPFASAAHDEALSSLRKLNRALSKMWESGELGSDSETEE